MTMDGLRTEARVMPADDLRERLERWSRSTGIDVEVWALPGRPLPGHVAELVQATVLDVLDGLEGDGSVRSVGIALTAGARGLRLTVSGHGQGLPPDRLADRLRVRDAQFAELGGGVSVNVVPGGGVTVSAALPGRPVSRRRGR
ncbi:hypothetical protein [Nonomuraea sp. SBT364]|uniref:hypothetical protein n=1 Tax=Nonomuraea sp. SBT364 TaxID=1580530 RepID=UPI00066C2C4F|nr:hypothetical protein [Nonomuraea sp. SBT364]